MYIEKQPSKLSKNHVSKHTSFLNGSSLTTIVPHARSLSLLPSLLTNMGPLDADTSEIVEELTT